MLMFLRNFLARQHIFNVQLAVVLLYSLLQWSVLLVPFPGFELAVQGLRKTLLILMAISIGMQVPLRHQRLVRNVIIFTLFYVCVYGIKQYFSFDSFDLALLAAQSSDIYSNMFGGQIRAMSLLSGAFHLGTAACALAAFAVFGDIRSKWLRALLWGVALAACYASITRTYIVLILAVPILTVLVRSKLSIVVGVYLFVLAGIMMELFLEGGISNILSLVLEDRRLGARAVSYTGFMEIWANNIQGLFTGFGLGSAGSALGEDFLSRNLVWIEPHNIFSKYLFELGIIVGPMAIWMLIWPSWKAIKRKDNKERWFILAIVLVVAISGLTITSVEVWPINWFIGILVGMAVYPKTIAPMGPAPKSVLYTSTPHPLPVGKAGGW